MILIISNSLEGGKVDLIVLNSLCEVMNPLTCKIYCHLSVREFTRRPWHLVTRPPREQINCAQWAHGIIEIPIAVLVLRAAKLSADAIVLKKASVFGS